MQFKKLVFLSFLFYAFNANAIEQINFDIDGLKVGNKLTQEFASNYCPQKSKEEIELECKRKLNIGGVNVSALYFFYNLSLVSVSLSFESNAYHDLVKAYSRKFLHKPHKDIREAIDLNTGEQYTNNKVLWVTDSGSFFIEKYGNNFTRGYAYLNSPEYIEYVEEKKAQRGKGTIRRIFNEVLTKL